MAYKNGGSLCAGRISTLWMEEFPARSGRADPGRFRKTQSDIAAIWFTKDMPGFETKPGILLFIHVILYYGFIRVDADERGKRSWIIRILGY